ncbi:MAG: hypothetical protein IAC58_06095 [Firmicutes bacterium]|uniref:Uncharacterized protein n=1 Tax=Candidatus Onthovivens merdipullorum TaxID=2840889 RepID=A0A9D9GY09_9BACL|nr:hypothetical protein [Candidatus Onthovivens merdipullorum]
MINLIWILFIIFFLWLTYKYFINSGLPKGSKVSLVYLRKFLLKKESRLNKLYKKDNNINTCIHIKYLSKVFVFDIMCSFILLILIVFSCVFNFTNEHLFNLFSIFNLSFICLITLINVIFLIYHELTSNKYANEDDKLNDLQKENLIKELKSEYKGLFD